jgi:hypothetical protein
VARRLWPHASTQFRPDGLLGLLSTTLSHALHPGLVIATPPSIPSASINLALQILLLIGFSWTAGFAVASLSRRTLWISAALCCSPCLFCLCKFHIASLPRASLFVFLAPAIVGAYQVVRNHSVSSRASFALALESG